MRTSHIALAVMVLAGLSIAGPVGAEVGVDQNAGADTPTNADYVRVVATTTEDEAAKYVASCVAGYLEYPQPCPFRPVTEESSSAAVELWAESNGCQGLQTTAEACGSSDTRVKRFPLGLQ